jgi:hypothetical protein
MLLRNVSPEKKKEAKEKKKSPEKRTKTRIRVDDPRIIEKKPSRSERGGYMRVGW